jgi:V8-like Glu-specific endopeptidase
MKHFLISLAILAATATCSAPAAFALPAIEGIVQPVEGDSAEADLATTGVAWRREVELDSESSFFRLHFTDIAVTGDGEFTIVVRSASNRVLATYSRREFSARTEFWTTYLFGHFALVEVVSGSASSGHVAFRIAEAAIETQGARVLSIQNQNNPQDRPLYEFHNNAPLAVAARPVAKLRFTRNRILYSCTGFLLANDLLLTNKHCIESDTDCATAVAQFGFQEDAEFNIEPGEEFRCDRVVDSDAGLDFALLRLQGNPGTKWGTLKWSTEPTDARAGLYLIQHPNGRPKRVARTGCIVKTPSAVGNVPPRETDMGHTCDTETGSSGSPVFDQGFKVVALHHLGFDRADPRWVKENRAVKASLLAPRIAPFIDQTR